VTVLQANLFARQFFRADCHDAVAVAHTIHNGYVPATPYAGQPAAVQVFEVQP